MTTTLHLTIREHADYAVCTVTSETGAQVYEAARPTADRALSAALNGAGISYTLRGNELVEMRNGKPCTLVLT